MDLVNAPNSVAITAIQSGLATAASLALAYNILNSGTYGNSALKALIDTVTGYVDTEVAAILAAALAIKAKTDNMPVGIKKNTEQANFEFLMVLASDHSTPAPGKTITAERSIDGAAFAACSNAASEVGSGAYKITFSASELNGEMIMFKFSATDCDTRFITVKTST
jgi:hypothetical protein